jgi:hypothetical protein
VTSNPRFLAPPSEREQANPYRPVWRSIVTESTVLVGFTLAAWIVVELLVVPLPELFAQLIIPVIIFLPLILWLLFSWLPERRVSQPRPQLLLICIISGLSTQSITIPLIEQVFQPQQWLALASAGNRIIGYAITTGVIHEIVKYIIVKYVVWPRQIRNRYDTLAYCVATAVGASVIFNLSIWLNEPNIAFDALMFRTLAIFALQMVGSLLISYGLAELQFGSPSILLLPFLFVISLAIIGIVIPIRAGLVNSVFVLEGISTPRSMFGIVFSIVVLITPMILVAFLHDNSERLSREAFGSKED